MKKRGREIVADDENSGWGEVKATSKLASATPSMDSRAIGGCPYVEASNFDSCEPDSSLTELKPARLYCQKCETCSRT
jgi:hypothetical protein